MVVHIRLSLFGIYTCDLENKDAAYKTARPGRSGCIFSISALWDDDRYIVAATCELE